LSIVTEPIFALCYDVMRSATRRRVAALLESHMVRVQDSVFEARLQPEVAYRLFADVVALGDEGDMFRLYGIPQAGEPLCRVAGGIPMPETGGFWLL
jgi:CRISPR-associated endonuclease Cas2